MPALGLELAANLQGRDIPFVSISSRDPVLDSVKLLLHAFAYHGATQIVNALSHELFSGDDPAAYKRSLLVVKNLIDNAVKYSNEPTRVDVTAKLDPRNDRPLCLTVSDTGCGIPRDKHELVFEVGESDWPKDVQSGFGRYGLWRARTILRSINGDVSLLRSDLGKGSLFRISLPVTRS